MSRNIETVDTRVLNKNRTMGNVRNHSKTLDKRVLDKKKQDSILSR
jgi:hypothetical protein